MLPNLFAVLIFQATRSNDTPQRPQFKRQENYSDIEVPSVLTGGKNFIETTYEKCAFVKDTD